MGNSIDSRALHTVWSNDQITINFGWLTGGKAQLFGKRLSTELKGIVPHTNYIPDAGVKSTGGPAEAWVPACDQVLTALHRLLTFTSEILDEERHTKVGNQQEVV